jgi:hypothetical protein
MDRAIHISARTHFMNAMETELGAREMVVLVRRHDAEDPRYGSSTDVPGAPAPGSVENCAHIDEAVPVFDEVRLTLFGVRPDLPGARRAQRGCQLRVARDALRPRPSTEATSAPAPSS